MNGWWRKMQSVFIPNKNANSLCVWSPQGLGAQEQGATDHIKVQVKNNHLGLGATINNEVSNTVSTGVFFCTICFFININILIQSDWSAFNCSRVYPPCYG